MPKVERLPSGSYRIRFVDPWGRRAVITRRTAADTRAAYKRALGDMARGEYIDTRQGRITLEAWADEWLAGARNLSTGGHDTYRRDLDRHILPMLGAVPIGRLSAGDVDRYLTVVGLGLAPSTVHRHYRTLHRMLEVARLRGLVAKNACEHVQPPVVPRVQRPVLDPEQIDQLADTISPRYRAWLYVMCYGGLRWSESVGLRRSNVNGGRVRVVEQLIHRGRGEWDRVPEPKSGSRRTVTLPAFAAGELARALGRVQLAGPRRAGVPDP